MHNLKLWHGKLPSLSLGVFFAIIGWYYISHHYQRSAVWMYPLVLYKEPVGRFFIVVCNGVDLGALWWWNYIPIHLMLHLPLRRRHFIVMTVFIQFIYQIIPWRIPGHRIASLRRQLIRHIGGFFVFIFFVLVFGPSCEWTSSQPIGSSGE